MKKYKDIAYLGLGITFLAAFVFAVYWSERAELFEADLSRAEIPSRPHQLIGEALQNPESFEAAVEMSAGESTDSVSRRDAGPLPIAGTPLPVAWKSEPAPDLDQVALSPSFQRSLAASASLRADEYTDPGSALNLARIEALREIRKHRASR